MEKENVKNVSSNGNEKKPKTYKELAIVLAGMLVFVVMCQWMGCYSCSSRNNAARYNGFEERLVNSVDEKITDALTAKDEVDGMKVDETRQQERDSIALYRKGKKWGFYNLNTGKRLFTSLGKDLQEFDNVSFFSEGLAAVEQDGKVGFVDMKGNVVIPCQFLSRWIHNLKSIVFQNGYCVMRGRDGNLGVIDKKGRWVIQPIYFDVSLTPECVFVISGNTRLKLNYRGEVMEKDMIVEIKRLSCKEDSTGYYAYYTRYDGDNGDDCCGLMDAKGNRLTAPIYWKIEMIGRGLFACRLCDKQTIEIKRF